VAPADANAPSNGPDIKARTAAATLINAGTNHRLDRMRVHA
jgi:hypothetical protein